MTLHLSPLEIDEVLTETRSPPGHLRECSTCRERLELAQADARRIRGLVGFERTHALLKSRPEQGARATPLLRLAWLPFALGATLAAVAFFVVPPVSTSRVKGAPTLSLLTSRGQQIEKALRPGERVRLTLGSAGHPYALVVALDPNGGLEQLWPPGAPQSGRAPKGAVAVLEPGFEVTPGDFLLYAVFSDVPLEARAVREALQKDAQRTHLALSARVPSALPGEAGHAQLFVHVER